jgi:hypothetical protein
VPAFEPVLPQTWRLRRRAPVTGAARRDHPTRDHADLLAAATDGVLSHTAYPDLRLIVVDNGSALRRAGCSRGSRRHRACACFTTRRHSTSRG